jgi:hypothetical protein
LLHDMGGLWPARPGTDRTMYAALKGHLHIGKLNGQLTWEIIVCLATPGFTRMSWAVLMGWTPNSVQALDQIVEAYAPVQDKVMAAGKANAASVTRDDAVDWLRAVLRRKPRYRGPAPYWTTLALRDIWAEQGGSQKAMLASLGLTGDQSWAVPSRSRGENDFSFQTPMPGD